MLKFLISAHLILLLSVGLLATDEVKLVTFETNYGSIGLEIYPEVAPNLTARFLELCEKGYYTGTYFHFIDVGFIIAGGDLFTRKEELPDDVINQYGRMDDEISAKALGLDRLLVRNSFLGKHLERDNPVRRWSVKELLEHQGYSFDDSLPSIPNEYGAIAIASNEPNSNYTQFFIITAQEGTPWLDGKNTAIGRIKKGMDTVHKIENLPQDAYHRPLPENRPVIENIIVE